MQRKYKIGFDMWGFLLFLIIMAPNFIWFAIPASNDVLRVESVTEVIDIIGSVLQVIMVAALCFIKYAGEKKINMAPYIFGVFFCIVAYFVGWIIYYTGNVGTIVILILSIAPCLAFVLFSIAKKNIVAAVAAIGFMTCHIIFVVVNFF